MWPWGDAATGSSVDATAHSRRSGRRAGGWLWPEQDQIHDAALRTFDSPASAGKDGVVLGDGLAVVGVR